MPSNTDFETYANATCEEFQPIQSAFIDLYDINSYKNWYYDHGYGVFEFRDGSGPDLYFKYADVGSFSTRHNTWMWSWDNESTPMPVKKLMAKVKAYGEANGYDDMTTGLIDGDEYTGWAMTSITAKLLNAIGAYRAPFDHLHAYFAFLNQITEDQFDEIKRNTIQCEDHTSARMALVCQHLINADNKGFHEAIDSDAIKDDDDTFQAWCDDCERLYPQEQDLSDKFKAFADMKVVCEECYFEIKKRNINNY